MRLQANYEKIRVFEERIKCQGLQIRRSRSHKTQKQEHHLRTRRHRDLMTRGGQRKGQGRGDGIYKKGEPNLIHAEKKRLTTISCPRRELHAAQRPGGGKIRVKLNERGNKKMVKGVSEGGGKRCDHRNRG